MIIFPATGVFSDLGPMGVSMFFVTAIVSQLVYTLGGSGFAGANGSMMIEVVVSLFLEGATPHCFRRSNVIKAFLSHPCQQHRQSGRRGEPGGNYCHYSRCICV